MPFQKARRGMVDLQDCIFISPTNRGYARLRIGGQRIYAHRHAYELVHGSIPEGFEIDHLCYQPNCVNVAHLELVSHHENTRRARHLGSAKGGAPKTGVPLRERQTCPTGHPYEGINLYIYPTGQRRCKECARQQLREFRRRRKSQGHSS